MVQLRKNALKHGFHRVKHKLPSFCLRDWRFLSALHLRHLLSRLLRSAIRIQFYHTIATPESVTPSETDKKARNFLHTSHSLLNFKTSISHRKANFKYY